MDNTSRRRRRMTRCIAVFISLTTVLVTLGEVAPSSAQSSEPIEDPGTEIPPEEVPEDAVPVEVEMLLDCSNLTEEAQAEAEESGACDSTRHLTAEELAMLPDDADVEGTVSPEDTRWGNCGSSFIFMWRRGGGHAGVRWGFFSILGTVFRRNLTVRWWNGSRGISGSYVDSAWMFSNAYSRSRSFYTRSGEVVVWLTGNVKLAWTTCVILVPVDYEIIT